jgi:hypothetical protein
MPRANWIRLLSLRSAICSALVAVVLLFLGGGVAQAQPTIQIVVGKEMQQVEFGKTSIAIPFCLSAPSSETVTVQFSTESFPATGPTFFLATSGTLIFAPGETEQAVVVTIVMNTSWPVGASGKVILSNPANAQLGFLPYGIFYAPPASGPPLPTVQFAAPTYTVNETGGSVSIQVTLSAVPATTATVNFATSDGPSPNGAVALRDYTATSGTLTFDPNDPIIANRTTQTFPVYVKNHRRPGPNCFASVESGRMPRSG